MHIVAKYAELSRSPPGVVLAGRCVHLHPNPSPTVLCETEVLSGSGLRFVVKRADQLFPKVHAV